MTNDLKIEQSILSSYIFSDFDGSIAREIKLSPDDFYHPFHQLLAKCINWLVEKELPTDEMTIHHYLSKNNNIGENEENMILDIMAANPFANPKPYIDMMKDNALKRGMLKL